MGMKIQTYSNRKLYNQLTKMEPEYYYGEVPNITEYRIDLFRRINLLLAENNIRFYASFYYWNKDKDLIELHHKSDWIVIDKKEKFNLKLE